MVSWMYSECESVTGVTPGVQNYRHGYILIFLTPNQDSTKKNEKARAQNSNVFRLFVDGFQKKGVSSKVEHPF